MFFSGICNESAIGDNICQPWNNHAACQYDGGDCCTFWVKYVDECGIRHRKPDGGGLIGFPKIFRDAKDSCKCHFTGLFNPVGWDIHRGPMEEGRGCTVAMHKIGDGICDDEADSDRCLNDHGDCCKPIIDSSRCTECICGFDGIKRATNIDEYLEYIKNYPAYNIREKYLAYEGEMRPGGNDVPYSYWSGEKPFDGTEYGGCGELKMFKSNGICEDFVNTRQCHWDNGDCCRPYVYAPTDMCTDCLCHETGRRKKLLVKVWDNCHSSYIGKQAFILLLNPNSK